MIGNNIVGALGAGSGIDTAALVKQLVDIEKAPQQNRIDNKRETLETQISDFGLVKSALATLQDAVDVLGDENTFGAKSASFSDSDTIIPTELGEDAPVGDYAFEVLDIAQAQSLSTSALFGDPSDAVGKGTLTIRFGQWDGSQDNFTVNAGVDAKTITIDDSNNSLNGLRDAINAADTGVLASIINDGSGYRLLLSAPSGAANQLEITVAEDGGSPTNTDASDLSRFAFGAGAANQQLIQNQAGRDASLKINGFSVTRSSNDIDDVVEGFSFTLAKAAPGEIFNISVFEDKAVGQDAVRGFVDAFNTFLTTVEPALGFDEEAEEFGSLYRDPTARSLITQLRNAVASAVPGVDSGFTVLSNVGIRTELDGSLSIDEEDFAAAFDNNFALVKTLFAPETRSSSDKILVNGFGDQTVPGAYEVIVTQEPKQGFLTGAAVAGSLLSDLNSPSAGSLSGAAPAAGLLTDLAGAGANDYDFTLQVDGVTSGTISITPGTYTNAGLAAELQSRINADATLGAADVTVTHDGTAFVITSNTTGASSSVSAFTAVGASAGDLGLAAGSSSAGAATAQPDAYDFAISVNGTTSGTISVTPGLYADHNALAAELQSRINADTTLQGAGASVTVSYDGGSGAFLVTSQLYGSKSAVAVSAIGASAADLGLAAGSGTAGQDVAGTVGGELGFGVGNVLLPKLDSDPYGLSFIVKAGATNATVNFSRGFGQETGQLTDLFLKTSGIFQTREDNLSIQLESLDDDQETLDRRIEAYQERLTAQYIAMEQIVNGLQQSGGFLEGILDRLPFTSSQR